MYAIVQKFTLNFIVSSNYFGRNLEIYLMSISDCRLCVIKQFNAERELLTVRHKQIEVDSSSNYTPFI